MKRHYIHLWALLAVAFAIFAVASAFEMPTVGGHELKSARIAETLFASRASEPAGNLPAEDFALAEAAPAPFPAPCDSSAQTILFIGDSMLEGLSPRLAAYCDASGHELYTVVWYSSTSEVWGQSDKLAGYVERIKPTFVIVCLGANELFVNDIEQKREKYVKKILSDIGDIPYLWIGPPNWKPDTGINRLIARHAAEGSFFLSDGMSFDRTSDGAHPTRKSAAAWLDSVASWMPEHHNHPILLVPPTNTNGRPRRTFVHQPNEK